MLWPGCSFGSPPIQRARSGSCFDRVRRRGFHPAVNAGSHGFDPSRQDRKFELQRGPKVYHHTDTFAAALACPSFVFAVEETSVTVGRHCGSLSTRSAASAPSRFRRNSRKLKSWVANTARMSGCKTRIARTRIDTRDRLSGPVVELDRSRVDGPRSGIRAVSRRRQSRDCSCEGTVESLRYRNYLPHRQLSKLSVRRKRAATSVTVTAATGSSHPTNRTRSRFAVDAAEHRRELERATNCGRSNRARDDGTRIAEIERAGPSGPDGRSPGFRRRPARVTRRPPPRCTPAVPARRRCPRPRGERRDRSPSRRRT